MLVNRPVLTLKNHLETFLNEEKRSAEAFVTVHRIAQERSDYDQMAYTEKVLQAIKLASLPQSATASDLIAELTVRYKTFKKAEESFITSKSTGRFTQAAKETYQHALYDFELAKSGLRALQKKIYQDIETWAATVYQNAEVKRDWWQAVDTITSQSITLSEHPKKTVETSILDKPISHYKGDPASKVDLSKVLSRDMSNYLFVKEKGEGYNKPGIYGGEYVCCFAAQGAHGIEIKVQRVLIKQDTSGTKIHHEKNIAEFAASEVLHELIQTDDTASIFYVRAPWNTEVEKPDEADASVYILSVFIDNFTDLYKDLFERNKLPSIEIFYAEASLLIQGIYESLNPLEEEDGRVLNELQKKIKKPGVERKKEDISEIYFHLQQLEEKVKRIKEQVVKRNLFKNLAQLRVSYEKIIEEPPSERPKGLNTFVEEIFGRNFTAIFQKNILAKDVDDFSPSSNCNYDNYAPLTVASLFIRDFDTHTANFGAIDVGGERKRLKRIDFGAAFKDFDEEVHIHSHSRHLPRFGPTNHIREWPRALRTNITFINELKRQASYPLEKLSDSFDRVLVETMAMYGGTVPLERFAKHVGLNVKNLRKNLSSRSQGYRDRLKHAIHFHLKDVMRSRQVSMRNLALEFEISLYAKRDKESGRIIPNDALTELVKKNPTYFVNNKLHFRHARQRGWETFYRRKKASYREAMQIYANAILEQSDVLCPVLKKNFDCPDKLVRAELLLTQLKIMTRFESNPDQQKQLKEEAENLSWMISKYRRQRGRLSNILHDTSSRHLISMCDKSYNAIKMSYEALPANQKIQIDQAMDSGELDFSQSSQVRQYCDRPKHGIVNQENTHKSNHSVMPVSSLSAAAPVESKLPSIEKAPSVSPVPLNIPSAPEYSVSVMLDTHKKLAESTALVVKSTDAVLESIVAMLVILSDVQEKLGSTNNTAKQALAKYSLFQPKMVEKVSEEFSRTKGSAPAA